MRCWVEKGGTYGAESAVLGTGNESLVVGIYVGSGDVACSGTPVIRVVLPDDGAETKGMSDGTDTVVDVTKGRLAERVRTRMENQGDCTDAPAGGRDANNQFNYFHLESVSKEGAGQERDRHTATTE